MADRFPAQIWIGGKISRKARLYPHDKDDDTTILQGLISSLNDDGASHEYGDVAIDSDCSETELLKYLDGALKRNPPTASVLHFQCDQAINGEFEATEAFCIEYDIPFDRNSDHYGEYDGENVYWRPGMDTPIVRLADARGNEIVCGETVRKAMALLVSYSQTNTHVDGDRNEEILEKAERLLKDACPLLPPDLEKFRIVV